MLPCLTSKLNLNRTIIKVIKKMFEFIKVGRRKQNVSVRIYGHPYFTYMDSNNFILRLLLNVGHCSTSTHSQVTLNIDNYF